LFTDKEIDAAVEKLLEKVIWTPKQEEEHLLTVTEMFIRRNIPTLIKQRRRQRALWRLQESAIQREYFGREFDTEERADLERMIDLISKAVDATWTDIGTYYGVNRAVKEYGWNLHYTTKKTLCIVCGTPKTEMETCPKCKIVTSVFTR